MITVKLADGRTLTFPDGTAQSVIQSVVRRMLGKEEPGKADSGPPATSGDGAPHPESLGPPGKAPNPEADAFLLSAHAPQPFRGLPTAEAESLGADPAKDRMNRVITTLATGGMGDAAGLSGVVGPGIKRAADDLLGWVPGLAERFHMVEPGTRQEMLRNLEDEREQALAHSEHPNLAAAGMFGTELGGQFAGSVAVPSVAGRAAVTAAGRLGATPLVARLAGAAVGSGEGALQAYGATAGAPIEAQHQAELLGGLFGAAGGTMAANQALAKAAKLKAAASLASGAEAERLAATAVAAKREAEIARRQAAVADVTARQEKAKQEALAAVPEDAARLLRNADQILALRKQFPSLPRSFDAGLPDEILAEVARVREQQRQFPAVPERMNALRLEQMLAEHTAARVNERFAPALEGAAKRGVAAPHPEPPAAVGAAVDAQTSAVASELREQGLSGLRQAGHEAKWDFVTEQKVDLYHAGERARQIREDIPDVGARSDALGLLQRTGNPLDPADTPAALQARVEASPHGPAIKKTVADWRARTDELHKILSDLRSQVGLGEFGFIDDYIHQVWEQPPETNVSQGRAGGPSTSSSVLDPRVFLNVAEGVKAGWKPKTVDIAELVGRTEQLFARAKAAHSLLRDLTQIQGMGDGLPAIVKGKAGRPPEGYYRADGYPVLARVAKGEGDSVFIHPDLWAELAPVLKKDDIGAIDKVLAFGKAANFAYSLFHAGSLTSGAVKTMGLGKGLREAGRLGFGVPGIAQLARKMGGGRFAEGAVEEAIRSGVTVDPPPLDASSEILQSALKSAAEWTGSRVPVVGKPLAAGIRGVAKVSEWTNQALWENLHAPIKVTAYHHLTDRLMRIRDGAPAPILPAERARLAAMSGDEIRREAAAFTNDAFGGQNWALLRNRVLSDPVALRWARRTILSPDWQVSSLRATTAAASRNPARAAMGRQLWVNAGKLYLMYNAMQYALTKLSDPNGQGHFMWENEDGHKGHLEAGVTDSRGRKVYYSVFKEEQELPDFILGREHPGGMRERPVLGFLARKAHPLPAAGIEMLTGGKLSDYGSPLSQLKERAQLEGRNPGVGEQMAATAETGARAFLPFTFGSEGGLAQMVPFATSKGLSAHSAIPALGEAMRDGDSAQVEEIKKTLSENGYDEETIGNVEKAAQRAVSASGLAVGQLIEDYGRFGKYRGETPFAPGFSSKPIVDLSRMGTSAAQYAQDLKSAESTGDAMRYQQIVKAHPEALYTREIAEAREEIRELRKRAAEERANRNLSEDERAHRVQMLETMATNRAGMLLFYLADTLRGVPAR